MLRIFPFFFPSTCYFCFFSPTFAGITSWISYQPLFIYLTFFYYPTLFVFCYFSSISIPYCPFVTNYCSFFRCRVVSCWSRGQSRTDQIRYFQNLSQSLYFSAGRVHWSVWCFTSSADNCVIISWALFSGRPIPWCITQHSGSLHLLSSGCGICKSGLLWYLIV